MSRPVLSTVSHGKLQLFTTTTENQDDISWIQLPSSEETIVKLRAGEGSPLIMIHGGGGTIHAFSPLQSTFSSPLWAIQVTPDTPQHSVHAQTRFYYDKIKMEQPCGPYRIASFSASSLLAVALVKLLEDNNNTVSQLAFVDHFPTTFLAPITGVDISQMPLAHPRARQTFIDASIDNLVAMTYRDCRGANPKRHKTADELRAAFDGRATSAFAASRRVMLSAFLNTTFDFLLSLETDARAAGDARPSMEFLEAWLRSVKAPVSAYIGTYGVLGCLDPQTHPKEEWYDLCVHRCFPGAQVTVLDAGHFDILEHPGLVKRLQEVYFTERARL